MEDGVVGCLFILFLLPVLFGILCAIIAENKGRSGVGWFFLGLLLPVIGIIAVLIAKPDHTELKKRKMVAKGVKKCRYCFSLIQEAATRCPHCSGDLTVEELQDEEELEM